jgi:hypothetical protein
MLYYSCYVYIARRFIVINVFNERKTLCSPCICSFGIYVLKFQANCLLVFHVYIYLTTNFDIISEDRTV